MKFIRYKQKEEVFYGMPIDENSAKRITGDIFSEYSVTDVVDKFENCDIMPPSDPSKIVAIGKNYLDHALEMGGEVPEKPIIFIKPSTSVLKPFGDIIYPEISQRVDFECELALIIKKTAKNISPENAKDYILGYTCLNDVTARDIQQYDGQWTRGKSFDTFCPVGPVISDEINPLDSDIMTLLNGEIKQKSNTKYLRWNAFELLSFVSGVMTLLPGDVLTTGTPAGIAPMQKGDKVTVKINGLPDLTNYIK